MFFVIVNFLAASAARQGAPGRPRHRRPFPFLPKGDCVPLGTLPEKRENAKRKQTDNPKFDSGFPEKESRLIPHIISSAPRRATSLSHPRRGRASDRHAAKRPSVPCHENQEWRRPCHSPGSSASPEWPPPTYSTRGKRQRKALRRYGCNPQSCRPSRNRRRRVRLSQPDLH